MITLNTSISREEFDVFLVILYNNNRDYIFGHVLIIVMIGHVQMYRGHVINYLWLVNCTHGIRNV